MDIFKCLVSRRLTALLETDFKARIFLRILKDICGARLFLSLALPKIYIAVDHYAVLYEVFSDVALAH